MLWAILDLFSHRPDFLLPCSLLYTYDEKFYKKSLNFYSLQVKNFTVIVSKMRVLEQKENRRQGGGVVSLLRVNLFENKIISNTKFIIVHNWFSSSWKYLSIMKIKSKWCQYSRFIIISFLYSYYVCGIIPSHI